MCTVAVASSRAGLVLSICGTASSEVDVQDVAAGLSRSHFVV